MGTIHRTTSWKNSSPDNLYRLCEQAVDSHVEDEPRIDGIDGENKMPENESVSMSGYDGSTHNDVVRSVIGWGYRGLLLAVNRVKYIHQYKVMFT